jgi:hypothetical protein
MPEGAAILAIRDCVQADLFLHTDGVLDAAVFEVAQGLSRQGAGGMLRPRLLQCNGSEQTADMVRTRW